ncbi:hypothetical protein RM96_35510 [Cupriavidus sp. IDO]|nr:hypothetical protein RM96_35510 [Cupriavidus sp. IDO]
MASTCGALSPVTLAAHVGRPLHKGRCDVDACLKHGDRRQQRWLAELRQAGAIVGSAHVVLDGELPSSSYMPWRNGMLPFGTGQDDNFAQCLAVARLCDQYSQREAAFGPAWLTIRYFLDFGPSTGVREALTVSPVRHQQLGPLCQQNLEVLEAGARVATLTIVHEHAVESAAGRGRWSARSQATAADRPVLAEPPP